jgi:hypothetical protein
LAEEAVIGEPVSARLFPVPRENIGKFADFGLEMTEVPRLSGGNSIGCERNSLAAKAGKICGRTGHPKVHNSERAAHLPQAGLRSSLHRLFQRHGISRLPEIEYQISERLTLGVVFKSPAM